jgi:hypothetical protein
MPRDATRVWWLDGRQCEVVDLEACERYPAGGDVLSQFESSIADPDLLMRFEPPAGSDRPSPEQIKYELTSPPFRPVGFTTPKDWVERRLEGARVERVEGIRGLRPDVGDLFRHPAGWWFVAVSLPPKGLARPQQLRPGRFAEVSEEEAKALSKSYGYGWPPKGAPPPAPAQAPAPGPPAGTTESDRVPEWIRTSKRELLEVAFGKSKGYSAFLDRAEELEHRPAPAPPERRPILVRFKDPERHAAAWRKIVDARRKLEDSL